MNVPLVVARATYDAVYVPFHNVRANIHDTVVADLVMLPRRPPPAVPSPIVAAP
jgi:hypothetical protein